MLIFIFGFAQGLGFLLGAPVTQQSTLSYEQIHAKLLQFFQNNAPFDDIKEWISVSFVILNDSCAEN